MLTQSKDQLTMASYIDDSSNLEPELASTCPCRPPDSVGGYGAPRATKASNLKPWHLIILQHPNQVSPLCQLNLSIPNIIPQTHLLCLRRPIISAFLFKKAGAG